MGVAQLPPAIGELAAGSIYGIFAEDFESRLALILRSLWRTAVRTPSVLITGHSPTALVRRAAAWGIDLAPLLQSRAIQVFHKQAEWSAKLFHHGPARFLRELEHFGLDRDLFIVVDQAEDLFSTRDAGLAQQQSRAYHEWVAQRGHTLLATFGGRGPGAVGFAALSMASENFAGSAQLAMRDDQGELRIEHWYAREGRVRPHAVPLVLTNHGELQLDQRAIVAIDTGGQGAQALDGALIATTEALRALGQPEGEWLAVDTYDELVAATRRRAPRVAALHYTGASSFAELARAVAQLRGIGGTQLAIAVREHGKRLRFSNELALIKLGANVILHASLGTREVALVLESLRGQTFTRPVEIDVESVLHSVAVHEHSGLVPISAFVRMAADAIGRSTRLGIPNALAVLTVAPGTAVRDLARRLRLRRAGDFYAADDARIYAFLSGCQAADGKAALASMFGGRLGTECSDIAVYDSAPQARTALVELQERLQAARPVPGQEPAAAARPRSGMHVSGSDVADSAGLLGSAELGRTTAPKSA